MGRSINLIIAILLLVPAGFFVLLLSLLIVVINHYPPFFKTKRIGKDGKIFTLYKLQTLKPPNGLTKDADPQDVANRMTFLGKIYKNHGWDELPQIINIILGQMSFVGPRPISTNFVETLKEKYPNSIPKIVDWLDKRSKVAPGLSGWHQIHMNDRNVSNYDLDYVTKPSIFKNVQIVLASLVVLVVGKNFYFGQEIPDPYLYTFD